LALDLSGLAIFGAHAIGHGGLSGSSLDLDRDHRSVSVDVHCQRKWGYCNGRVSHHLSYPYDICHRHADGNSYLRVMVSEYPGREPLPWNHPQILFEEINGVG